MGKNMGSMDIGYTWIAPYVLTARQFGGRRTGARLPFSERANEVTRLSPIAMSLRRKAHSARQGKSYLVNSHSAEMTKEESGAVEEASRTQKIDLRSMLGELHFRP